MEITPLVEASRLLFRFTDKLSDYTQYAINITVAVLLLLLVCRVVTDALKLNPFGFICAALPIRFMRICATRVFTIR
jgi:hypothetical protein